MGKVTCVVCERKYPHNTAMQLTKDKETVCAKCANEVITVFWCGPKGSKKFMTDDICEVRRYILESDVDEVSEIKKKNIKRIKYMDADEFQGF